MTSASPLPLFRAENHRGEREKSEEEKEPRGSAEVERKKEQEVERVSVGLV